VFFVSDVSLLFIGCLSIFPELHHLRRQATVVGYSMSAGIVSKPQLPSNNNDTSRRSRLKAPDWNEPRRTRENRGELEQVGHQQKWVCTLWQTNIAMEKHHV